MSPSLYALCVAAWRDRHGDLRGVDYWFRYCTPAEIAAMFLAGDRVGMGGEWVKTRRARMIDEAREAFGG